MANLELVALVVRDYEPAISGALSPEMEFIEDLRLRTAERQEDLTAIAKHTATKKWLWAVIHGAKDQARADSVRPV